ncbi:hypothetical protein FHT87_003744 [Rhizobium sp. BK316]|uniref:hypothetical protein n=1 Tax=Rhizobium sp. BK316 TaxID=2587053 RepID=UPI0017B8ABBB|nr:hypothetical protein [Rhizobium sp. BK316]MBB3409825.1 hypothetical protein [Rhizobium sp. BK316]
MKLTGCSKRHCAPSNGNMETRPDANSNPITEGKSDGWRLIYCTGSEGEQLEFVQALGPVKQTFDDAFEARRKMVAASR